VLQGPGVSETEGTGDAAERALARSWAGAKRERADRAGPVWEKVKRGVRPGFKLG
jgi:hypothetical protein